MKARVAVEATCTTPTTGSYAEIAVNAVGNTAEMPAPGVWSADSRNRGATHITARFSRL